MSDISQRLQSLSPEKKALLVRELKKKGTQFNFFPLSFAQQRLWLLDQLEPGNPSYNISTAIRFSGHLDVVALERSLRIVVQRHESLRTTFTVVQGQPVQVIASSPKVSLPLIDLSGLDASQREPELQNQAYREGLHSFDLAHGPLIRVKLFRLNKIEHVAVLNIHHIISDGWSTTILLRELSVIYSSILTGQLPQLPPLPIQYADYAAWQRNWLQGEVLAEHLSYWRQQLEVDSVGTHNVSSSGNEKREPTILNLPTDRPRPAIQTYRGNMETLLLPSSLSQHMRDVSRKEGVTLFMTLLTIFQILLSRYSGQEDLIVGIPIANRNRAEIEGLIGFFVNSLALRTNLSGNPSFHDLLMRVREAALGAYAHQDLPFDKLVEEISPERNLSHTPLFQVYFNMINLPSSPTDWPGLTVNIFVPREAGSKFDLTLYATDNDEGIQLELLYNTDLFDRDRMLAMLRQYSYLASQVLNVETKIADFSLVTPAEQTILPDPAAPLSNRWIGSVQELLAQQALRLPEKLAVIDAAGGISYQELDTLSNRLAHYLCASGITPGDVIAIYAHQSLSLIPAVFGILKAGAACLMLDPAYPSARLIEYMTAVNLRGLLHIQAAGPLPVALESFLATSSCRCRLELPQRLNDLCMVLASYSPHFASVEVGPDTLAFVTFTSGSTGQPKGVLQRHGPLSHFLPWQQRRFGLQEAGRYSLLSGLAHDPLQREIFTPLCLGGTICIPPPEHVGSPGWLAAWMQQQAINVAHFTPAMLQLLTHTATGTTDSITLPALRCALTVGDALTRRDVARLYALAPAVTCINLYGSTETHRALSYFVIPGVENFSPDNAQSVTSAREIIPLGQGIEDTQLLVLNSARQVAGIGELGELYIRSPHLAVGYLNDAVLTRERFIPNPFTTLHGDRLYCTGDLGRYRPDGNVEFAGRNDQQVKLRGFRIELAEIEAVLGLHPAVREAVVIIREDTQEQKRLVAYVVSAQVYSQESLNKELRDFLATRLPSYMLPSVFVALDSLPLTPNRKVDRRALPIPETILSAPESVSIPRTPMEEILAGIWARILGREQVGIHDNFFDLGGHSLLATQLLSRIAEAFQQKIPLRILFETPTIAGLAAYIEQHKHSLGEAMYSQQTIHSLSSRLSESYQSTDSSEPFTDSSFAHASPSTVRHMFPLSFAQERLWFLDQLDPGNAAYTISVQLHIQGKLVVRALQQSIYALIERHEILRTTFVNVQGTPMQNIAASLDVPLSVLDLSELNEVERQSQLQHCLQNEAQRSFDLARGPLFYFILLRLNFEDHLCLFSIHHSIADAWSIDVFFRELNSLYISFSQGNPLALATLPVQYTDYALWQRQWLQGEVLARQLTYWKAQLADAPSVLALPTDHPRPPVQTYHGARFPFALSPSLSYALVQMSRRYDVTLYMTLLAAFQTLLSRYSGQQDILVGTPIAGRTAVEVEGLIGFFVNTLVMRGNLSGDPTFSHLLRRMREVALDAYAHQDVPFEKLVEELQPERDLSTSPFFQVMFILQNTPDQTPQLADLSVTPLEAVRIAAQYDLTLVLWQENGMLQGYIEYNTDLFEKTTIERLTGHLRTLLESIVSDPAQCLSQLPILTTAERQQLLVEWNSTQVSYPLTESLPALFEQQTTRTPDAIAIVSTDAVLSYEEVNQRANALAHYLRKRGVGPATLVALCVERSLDMLVGVLGILKSGAAYVPLDPSYPKERLAFMLDDAHVALLLTHHHLHTRLPVTNLPTVEIDTHWQEISCEPMINLSYPKGNNGEDLAYVIYTSGSTGQPKGVQITHRALLNFLFAMQAQLRLQQQDILLAVTSLSFDIAGLELYLPLLVGGRILLAAQEEVKDGQLLTELLTVGSPTFMQATPATWRLLLEAGWQGNPYLHILCGGEAFPADLADQLLPRGASLWNLYGPTETTIWSLTHQVQSLEQTIPIGRPIANTRVYILDTHWHPVPVGVPGDLYIGGDGLARGYLHRPDLTAERFLPDPFSTKPGQRLYYTGDQARYIADGRVEFLGRIDQQIKLRGYRIELGEIESVIAQYPGVRQSVVALREDEHGEPRLVAYIVGSEGPPLAQNGQTLNNLRSFLAGKLPDYMLPSAVVLLSALPLTANGKVDRKALPAPIQSSAEQQSAQEALQTPIEELLTTIWEQVLHVEHIRLDDNFFALGGHSLLATQIIARVRDLFGVSLPLRGVFETPTVAALAEKIEMVRHSQQSLTIPPLAPALRSEHLPLSFAQQRLWFLEQLHPGDSSYNIPVALRITGNLDVVVLQRSFNEIVRRHEALRTTFMLHDGYPLQVIHPPFSVSLPLIDLQGIADFKSGNPSAAIQDTLVSDLVQTHVQQPFALNRGPLFKGMVLRVSGTEHILLLTMHHIISDAWSIDVLLHELGLLYTAFASGHSSVPPVPTIQYADYAVWQRQWLQGEVLDQLMAYWKEQLADAPSVLELPTDHPRPPVQTYQGAHYPFQLSPFLSHGLHLLSHTQGVTLYMTLLAAFQTLLSRYSGQQQILVGTPIAGRTAVEVEGLIGFFVNTLVMRGDLSGDPTFSELLRRVREVALDAYAHQDLPFEKLVEELQPQRDLSTSPLFQVMFILQNTPAQSLNLSHLTLTPLQTLLPTAKFDLTLTMWQEEGILQGYLEYNTDLFEPSTIQRMAGHLRTLLEGIVANPDQQLSQLPLLTTAERQRQLVEWNATQVSYPLTDSLSNLFEQQTIRTPDAIAVVYADMALSYEEVNRRANALAHYLRKRGVGPDTLIGLCVERSLDMLVGILAILKSGAAYVPLDPSYPEERLAFMLSDAQVTLLLTHHHLQNTLPVTNTPTVLLDAHWHEITCEPATNLAMSVCGENVAYIIYTSGSTGQPKGVVATHRATLNRLYWMWERFPFTTDERSCQKTSLSFVDSIWEIFGSLLHGISTVILPDEIVKDPPRLTYTLAEQGITRIVLVPTLLHAVLDTFHSASLPHSHVKYWISSGEALSSELAERFLSRIPDSTLLNLYGSSEVAADATCYLVTRGQGSNNVPIGRPIANTQVYVLDEQLQPVPIGVPGEIYIGGAGLARGYLHRPELTAEKFLPHPFSQQLGAFLYRTGDLARYLPDGNIIYLGRSDRQVKIRGYRIEAQEIEAVLAQHPSVSQAVVALRSETASNKRLVAYVVPHDGASSIRNGEQPLTTSALRTFLQSKLPEYMLPSAIVLLPALPLTPNGKIDWQALPVPRQEAAIVPASRPLTPVEEILMDVWAEVLERERVGAFDNFFEMGGHSLLATQVIARVRALFKIDLSVLTLFESPTVATFAESLIEDEPVPGQIIAMATVHLKIKRMSPQEVRERLDQRKKARRN